MFIDYLLVYSTLTTEWKGGEAMTRKDYELIAQVIWRSGYIKDKNKIRQEAREQMRRLIVSDFIGSLKKDNPQFNPDKFLKACGMSV